MVEEKQDRDTIASSAIAIASAEERDAYIAQACGNDADLRRQVEEQVALYVQAGNQQDPPAPPPPARRLQNTPSSEPRPAALTAANSRSRASAPTRS